MTFNEYAIEAKKTVAYKDDDQALDCVIAGLAGELGETLELWKKYRREDYKSEGISDIDAFRKFQKDTEKELGDLLWYITIYAHLWNIDMEDVAMTNVKKLRDRLDRGVLHASGNER